MKLYLFKIIKQTDSVLSKEKNLIMKIFLRAFYFNAELKDKKSKIIFIMIYLHKILIKNMYF